jgi:hypothetical protein
MSVRNLLLLDGILNLAVGVFLLVFPRDAVAWLGIPGSASAFYPSLLGAVLAGIGIALLLERSGKGGLGLRGAIAINLCVGLALAGWLLSGSLELPLRGTALLWVLVALALGISGLEIVANAKRSR